MNNQNDQHESLHKRLNSIDKNIKEKNANSDVDLDAMLDKAESSLSPISELHDDEDAIDRLLMNAGFEEDDALMADQDDTADNFDDLDDLLSFDGFGESDLMSVADSSLGQTQNSTLGNSDNDAQFDEDALDRLVMNTPLDGDFLPDGQAGRTDDREQMDSFSDFSDFNETDIDSTQSTDDSETVDSSTDESEPRDELDDFLNSIGDIDESDMILDDDVSMADQPDPDDQPTGQESAIQEESSDEDELDSFSDFSDFNESIPPQIDEETEAEHSSEGLSAAVSETDISGDNDEFDLEALTDSFDESDLILDDETEAPLPPDIDSGMPEIDEGADILTYEEPEEFSVEDELDGSDIDSAVEIDEPEPIEDHASAIDNALENNELSDFDLLAEGLDESDLIQDDPDDLTAPESEQESLSEHPFDYQIIEDSSPEDYGLDAQDSFEPAAESIDEGLEDIAVDFDETDLIDDELLDSSADLSADGDELPEAEDLNASVPIDENSFNDLFDNPGPDLEASGMQEQPAVQAEVQDQEDDISSLIDDFTATDLIQDDESAGSFDSIVADEEQSIADDQPAGDILIDDDSFNSLFAGADFSEQDAEEQEAEQNNIEIGDDTSLSDIEIGDDTSLSDIEIGDDTSLSDIDSIFQLNEENDQFTVQSEENDFSGIEQSSDQEGKEDDFLLPDFDITADSEISDVGVDTPANDEDELIDDFSQNDFLDEPDPEPSVEPVIADQQNAVIGAVAEPSIANIDDVQLNPFEFELDDLKKQLEDAETKVKKSKRYSYLAMGFGAVALTAAAGLGALTYQAKNEVSKLTEAVTTLEANLAKSAANTPSQEVDAMRDTVVSLNKQVDGVITELKTNPEVSAELLNHKLPSILAKQEMVSKALDMLQVKVGSLEEKASSKPAAPAVVEPPKVEVAHEPPVAPVKEEHLHENAAEKNATGHEPVKDESKHDSHESKHVADHSHANDKEAKPLPDKKEQAHEHEQAPAPAQEKAEHEPAAKQKPQLQTKVVEPPAQPKTFVEDKPVKISKPAAIGKWGVNLAAFKQEWFAKSKAAEYARQGVFAEVIPVREGNGTMYRLRVGGFKSRAEANANTARIKQALNLDSVWVSDN